ncbi:hypothetical protein DEU56DRAFT_915173 [Suillus clintonianus]|uniref:uncharacterized protein n=1 Tax=Suillus clintonianus TaxID=1904413 RepID=UPI001B85C927|nr:uncharacterized protein DEU56DRAFT_915173 [Suillus clintonianus]KAG2129460.1 hypothetical protein DEU56DRAFT_915173 [Suillus clintonianus]
MNFYQHTAQAHSNHHTHYHITSSQEPVSDDNEALELNFPSHCPGANLHIAYDLDSSQHSFHFNHTARSSLPLSLTSSSSQSQPTISTSLDPAEERKLVEEATCTSYLKLYQHRALKTRISESKTWEIQCPDQGCWVKTGIRTHIELTTRGQFMALEKHHGSQTCGPKRKLQKTVQVSMKISHLTLNTAFHPTRVSQNSSNWNHLLLSNLPHALVLPCTTGQCNLGFPSELTSHGYAHKRAQTNYLSTLTSSTPRINSLAQLAKDRNHYTRHGILTPVQLLEVITEWNTSVNSLNLQSLNDDRKIKRLLSQLEDHTSLVMALSQCDVPWLWNLLQMALKNGASVHTILHLIEDAIE